MINPFKILVKLDDEQAMPVRANATDAGADLFASASQSIFPGETKMIDTGFAVKIPVGYVGLVYNRSSQGKRGVVIPHSVGVIDSDYRGNVKVLLSNIGVDPYHILKYDTRIAQLVVQPIEIAQFTHWSDLDGEWLDTDRGVGGFGSTGG